MNFGQTKPEDRNPGFYFWAGTIQRGSADLQRAKHLDMFLDFLSTTSEENQFMSHMEGNQVFTSKNH
jgi:hypothetical protein